MIFHRWFWFSILGSLFAQSVHWTPAMADFELPEPSQSDWICYHSGSSIRSFGRQPAIEETTILGGSFTEWAAGFETRLQLALSRR